MSELKGIWPSSTTRPNAGPIRRIEYEYAIPVKDASFLLEHVCEQPTLFKHRTKITIGGFCWEVDEFHGTNKGLVIAEIELETEEQSFEKPDWIGEDVSDDPRYLNINLIQNPFQNWKQD